MSRLTVRRVACVFAATASVIAVVPAATASAATSAGPGVCPKTGVFAFTSTLTHGAIKLGSNATVSNSSGAACGVVKSAAPGKLVAVVQPANTRFAPVTTVVGGGLQNVPTTLKAAGPLSGPTTLGLKGLTTTLGGKVVATSTILGQKCDIPLTIKLTTGKSGALTGKELVADNKGVNHGRLVDGTFAVPAIQPSATCNAVVATLANTLLGLPLASGKSSIVYDVALKLG